MSSEIFDPKLLGKEKKMKNKIKSLAFIKEKNRRSLKVSNYLQLESSGFIMKKKKKNIKPLIRLSSIRKMK